MIFSTATVRERPKLTASPLLESLGGSLTVAVLISRTVAVLISRTVAVLISRTVAVLIHSQVEFAANTQRL